MVDIFTDQGHRHLMFGVTQPVDHLYPARQIGLTGFKTQTVNDNIVQPLLMQQQRNFVNTFTCVQGSDDCLHGHIGEQGNLGPLTLGNIPFTTGQDHIGSNTD